MRRRHHLVGVFIGALLFALLVAPIPAAADITVRVGYSGGPFYVKGAFSDAEIARMSEGPFMYSTFDKGEFLRKGFGYGVTVENLFEAADVDPYGLWRFYFVTRDAYMDDNDGYGNNYWTWEELSRPRYYYDGLAQNYDFEQHGVYQSMLQEILNSAENTPAILASRSSYRRVDSLASWDDMSQMSADKNYRLLFGTAQLGDVDARFNAHSITEVICVLGGRPEINLEQTDVEGKVGDEFTIRVTLKSNDELVTEQGVKDIEWESLDKSVATVTKNFDGSITIKIVGEGKVNISGNFGRSPHPEFQASGSVGVNKIGEGTGSGTDVGSGSGSGTEGEGTGSGTEGEGTGAGDGTDDKGSGGSGGDDEIEREGEGTAIPEGSDLRPVNSSGQASDPAPAPSDPKATESIDDDLAPLSASLENAASGEMGAAGGSAASAWQLTLTSNEEEEEGEEDEEGDEDMPFQLFDFDKNPGRAYGMSLGALLCLGGLYRVGHYELARDRYQPKRRPPRLEERAEASVKPTEK
jgi:ribosomal protein L12E/L44/L45/RPP1/RPP2